MNAAIRTRHPTVNTRPPRRAVLRVSGDCRFSNILMRVETMTLLVRLARRRVARVASRARRPRQRGASRWGVNLGIKKRKPQKSSFLLAMNLISIRPVLALMVARRRRLSLHSGDWSLSHATQPLLSRYPAPRRSKPRKRRHRVTRARPQDTESCSGKALRRRRLNDTTSHTSGRCREYIRPQHRFTWIQSS